MQKVNEKFIKSDKKQFTVQGNHNVDMKILQTYCKIAESLMGHIDSLDDIKIFLKKEFNVNCSIEDLERVYALDIATEEANLLYKQYGYEENGKY